MNEQSEIELKNIVTIKYNNVISRGKNFKSRVNLNLYLGSKKSTENYSFLNDFICSKENNSYK